GIETLPAFAVVDLEPRYQRLIGDPVLQHDAADHARADARTGQHVDYSLDPGSAAAFDIATDEHDVAVGRGIVERDQELAGEGEDVRRFGSDVAQDLLYGRLQWFGVGGLLGRYGYVVALGLAGRIDGLRCDLGTIVETLFAA